MTEFDKDGGPICVLLSSPGSAFLILSESPFNCLLTVCPATVEFSDCFEFFVNDFDFL